MKKRFPENSSCEYNGNMKKRLPGKAKQVLTLLANGEILKFNRSPRGYFKLAVKNPILWSRFQRKTLLYAINLLHLRGFVEITEGLDGITTIAVSAAGKAHTADASAAANKLRPVTWDRKWRLILVDVPERNKKSREAFRYHLRRGGFAEFKRSAFLYPFPCAGDIDELAERLGIKDCVAMVTAESISDEFKFKKHFGLL